MSGERPSSILRLFTEPLDALWRLSATPHMAAGLGLFTASLIALGLALPQVPYSLIGSPEGLAHWLANLQAQHGAWLNWPARLGLLSLFSGVVFRLAWAAIGLAILVATTDTVLIWRSKAVRWPIPWHLLAHVGLLVLLLGALIEERWGWEQERLLLGVGKPAVVGLTGRALYLEQLGEEQRAPTEGVSIRWQQDGRQGRTQLRTGWPLVVLPFSLHLQQAGSAVQVRAVDRSGQAMALDDPAAGNSLQPEAVLCFGQASESRYLGLPARDWVIRVAHQPSAMGGPPFTLGVYQGQDLLAEVSLSERGDVTVGEIRLLWQVLPYAELRVAMHPGLGFWFTGWLLICLGLGASSRGRWLGAGRLRWPWGLASLGLGGGLWLMAGGLHPAGTGRLVALAGAILAWAGALLLLGALAGLLSCLGWQRMAQGDWPAAIGWAALAWTAGGGLNALAHWTAEGTLWHWEPWQAWWGLVWCLLMVGWHLRRLKPRWLLLVWLGLTAAVAVAGLLTGMVQ